MEAFLSVELFRQPTVGRSGFRSLELGASVTYNAVALARLLVRAAVVRGADPNGVYGYQAGLSGSEWERFTWRVWWEPETRWRGDMSWNGGQTDISIVRDRVALVYLPNQRMLYTNEPVSDPGYEYVPAPIGIVELPTIVNRHAVFPLLHPPLPSSEWEFVTLATAVLYQGRVARRVRALRRTIASRVPLSSGFWPGIDEYECLVDDDLGILLGLTGFAEEVRVADIAVNDVRVDAAFPSSIFNFVAPRGTRIVLIHPDS